MQVSASQAESSVGGVQAQTNTSYATPRTLADASPDGRRLTLLHQPAAGTL